MSECPYCKRQFTAKEIVERRQKRIQNALDSRNKAKANGNKLGRKKIRDDLSIRKLRALGYTIRFIANLQGISTASVMRALKT